MSEPGVHRQAVQEAGAASAGALLGLALGDAAGAVAGAACSKRTTPSPREAAAVRMTSSDAADKNRSGLHPRRSGTGARRRVLLELSITG
jgi:hypothetical protein